MRQATRTLTPFDFRSDFSSPAAAPDQVMLTAEEVAGLIAKVRADTLAEVTRQQSQEALDRLDAAAAALRETLAQMVQLMSLVETAGYDAAREERLRGTLDGAARRLIDGQGELFAVMNDLSASLDNPPRNG